MLATLRYSVQLEELVLKRGPIPRLVLESGLKDAPDESVEAAITEVSMQGVTAAGPETSRASHRIAKIHPAGWREGGKDPARP
jgi:hypothetical protein